MKTARKRLDDRMRLDRTHSDLTLNLPDDVIETLKEVAPALGFGDHIALARTYIGRGLRRDLEQLDQAPVMRLTESLRKQGLSDSAISLVIREADLKRA